MRQEKIITLNDRGNELMFKIKEMPALKLESWLIRAGLLLVGSGAFDRRDITNAQEALQQAGAMLSQNGISALAKIDFEKAQPLLDDLLRCCFFISGKTEQQLSPEIVDGIIEDVKTLFELRKEALKINVGFFLQENKSDIGSKKKDTQGRSNPEISVH